LFDLVVERYAEHRRAYLEDVMGQPTARLAAQRFLEGAAEHDTAPGEPRGCLTVQGGLATNVEDQEVAALLAQRRAANQEVLQRRLEQGLSDGDLPAGTDCVALARYLCTVSQGISVQASGGASREQLLEVAAIVVAAMPGAAGDPAARSPRRLAAAVEKRSSLIAWRGPGCVPMMHQSVVRHRLSSGSGVDVSRRRWSPQTPSEPPVISAGALN
jgi:AcrR family transcriptional regulator